MRKAWTNRNFIDKTDIVSSNRPNGISRIAVNGWSYFSRGAGSFQPSHFGKTYCLPKLSQLWHLLCRLFAQISAIRQKERKKTKTRIFCDFAKNRNMRTSKKYAIWTLLRTGLSDFLSLSFFSRATARSWLRDERFLHPRKNIRGTYSWLKRS